ncbi:metallophosphoesterase [Paraburkholderia tropica]|uniref:3',5'-cyclic AMP phosphodiesterase CpdA n=1 Tax=Paraburkholderia tropica TaxID=92647 RepID=A0ABX5MRL0_9BURK|nr:metallophosphoesterase [Paraburkholderia tropica]MBB3001738.1 DNA repair exonuclease SbcCD nuclease subunit [Paraburkholderia tropica]MBB6321066.1 DNA repair exonuclease SbcCD nuclease subunit [Paraburkholderia tropica]MDE1144793.1 metallophosphoesterase [Paraburkholderia tropica]PXX15814.1 3',5'-cyclic AMP phosphodiesterase CpdA [Paraburkholderia tropica]PZW82073.1 3',5'-cyclic AMP phosphodiesterase CpdA [Paraburkholderia tropica]
MRIQIASDLHLDALDARFAEAPPFPPAPGADVLVLAGDIHRGTQALDAFANWPVPVVYVCGNHEAYGGAWRDVTAALHARAEGTHVHFLERSATVIGNVRFLGCCLWTDYALYGNRARDMQYALDTNSDHSAITLDGRVPFSPEDALLEHQRSVSWLVRELAAPFKGKTIVVTHHGISPDSIHDRFATHPDNPAFLSDLRYLLPYANLWIHGHVHDSFDYRANGARVVTNPRGYPLNAGEAQRADELVWENRAFDPLRTIEV